MPQRALVPDTAPRTHRNRDVATRIQRGKTEESTWRTDARRLRKAIDNKSRDIESRILNPSATEGGRTSHLSHCTSAALRQFTLGRHYISDFVFERQKTELNSRLFSMRLLALIDEVAPYGLTGNIGNVCWPEKIQEIGHIQLFGIRAHSGVAAKGVSAIYPALRYCRPIERVRFALKLTVHRGYSEIDDAEFALLAIELH